MQRVSLLLPRLLDLSRNLIQPSQKRGKEKKRKKMEWEW